MSEIARIRIGESDRPIRFDGQVAIVTGAGRGLGAAYARLIARLGGAVVVHDAGVAQDGSGFDRSVADSVASEIVAAGGIAAACHDNLDQAAACRHVIDFALDRFGRIDALVHNAGLVVFSSLEETDAALWDRIVAVGVNAPFHLARAAAPHMVKQGYGRIILTTSGRALRAEDCLPGLTAYATTKMAQVGLMVGLAAELRDAGVCSNAISPVAATRVLRRSAPELLPELVAPGVAFLASAACPGSGLVLAAAGGRFSAAAWNESPEVDFGPSPASVDDIAARWDEIAGTIRPQRP